MELVRRLELEAMHPTLPDDDIAAHRNPSTLDRRLSDSALENLQRWYARDYEFFEECRELRLRFAHVITRAASRDDRRSR